MNFIILTHEETGPESVLIKLITQLKIFHYKMVE